MSNSKIVSKEDCKAGVRLKEYYIKCPHLEKKCRWLLDGKHGAYSYLDDACYLSGSFKLECPE